VLTYGLADAVVVQTSDIAKWMENSLKITPLIFPNPIDLNAKVLTETNTKMGTGKKVVAGGRLSFQKGFDFLIDAFSRVADKNPSWTLSIYGDGPELENLKNRAKKLGLKDRVEFQGIVPDLRSRLSQCDLFVHSARYEGYPNVVMEALASNCCVVATDCPGGTRELLQDGRYGKLVPCDDVEKLSMILSELMNDDSLRQHMAENASGAVKDLDSAKISKRWTQLFESLKSRNSVPEGGIDTLLVISQLGVGGTENHVTSLCQWFNQQNAHATVFNMLGVGKNTQALQESGFPVLMPKGISLIRNFRALSWLMWPVVAVKLFKTFRSARPKVTHFFLPASYIVGSIVALVAGIDTKRVMSRRSLNTYHKKYPFISWIESCLNRRTHAFLGNSIGVTDQLLREVNITKNQMGLIYNGVDFLSFENTQCTSDTRERLGLQESSFVMIIVANLIPYKGHMDLFEALGSISSRLPENWHLIVVGEGDAFKNKLVDKVSSLGLDASVSFLGSRSDVPDLLVASDMGVLSSHEEGFSNFILEGMAARLPMVVTDVGGNPEAVINGKTGIVVSPHDPNSLGQAILKLAKDKELSRSMGEAGYCRVRDRFSQKQCIANYNQLYEGLLEGKSVDEISAVRVQNYGSF